MAQLSSTEDELGGLDIVRPPALGACHRLGDAVQRAALTYGLLLAERVACRDPGGGAAGGEGEEVSGGLQVTHQHSSPSYCTVS
jgi:hypothetical protein